MGKEKLSSQSLYIVSKSSYRSTSTGNSGASGSARIREQPIRGGGDIISRLKQSIGSHRSGKAHIDQHVHRGLVRRQYGARGKWQAVLFHGGLMIGQG